MPPDAPLRRIGRVLLVGVLVYLVPPLGVWWAWRKVLVTVVTAIWLPLWLYAMWLAATGERDSATDLSSTVATTAAPATTPSSIEDATEPEPSETLDEWWSTSWPLFDLMNEDLHSIEEAGRAEDRTSMADACYSLWGSLTSIQQNPPPVAAVAAPLDAYLDEALPGSKACYEGLDNADGAAIRSATKQLTSADELFEEFKDALGAEGIEY